MEFLASWEVLKCENADCLNCDIRPVKDIGFMSLLKLLGGYIPSPILSKTRKNHYMTLDETVIESRMCNFKFETYQEIEEIKVTSARIVVII